MTIQEPIRILVIEDSEDDRSLYVSYFRRKGFVVNTAANGRKGLETAIRVHPHLILLDLWLPRKNGWDVINGLKAHGKTKDIPIIIVTGHFVSEPLVPGAAACLIKPIRLNRLEAEVSRIIAARGLLQTQPVAPSEGSSAADASPEIAKPETGGQTSDPLFRFSPSQ